MEASNETTPGANQPVSGAQAPLDIQGTKDGNTAADHDQPYRFGRRPTVTAPYPFSERQYARLLILRSRLQADLDSKAA